MTETVGDEVLKQMYRTIHLTFEKTEFVVSGWKYRNVIIGDKVFPVPVELIDIMKERWNAGI